MKLHWVCMALNCCLSRTHWISSYKLEPSINGLVTDGNTKLCCRGLVQSTTVNKIDSEHT